MLRFLWLLSAVFIVYGTTIPFHFIGEWSLAASNLSHVSPNPLIAPDTGLFSLPDLTQNLLLFLPFGVFGVGALSRGGFRTRVLAVTALAALLSLTVETLQLFTLDRIASLSDILANTLGALAGALASRPIVGRAERAIEVAHRKGWISAPAAYPALVVIVILMMSAWQPFDLTVDAATIWWKFRLFLAFPWQFRGLSEEPLEALRLAIAAAAMAAWCRQVGVRGWAVRAAVGCGLLAVALEAGELFVESRMPGLAGVVAGLAGVSVGGLAMRVLPRARLEVWAFWTIASGSIAAAAVLCLGQAVSDPFQLALAYFPLGFVVGVRAGRPARAAAAAAGVAWLIAGLLAFMQSRIAQRGVDIAGVGAAIFGGIAGAWAATSGWSAYGRLNARK